MMNLSEIEIFEGDSEYSDPIEIVKILEQNKNLKKLDISSVFQGYSEMKIILQKLITNETIKELNISDNPIISYELFRLIKYNKTLQKLNFSHCNLLPENFDVIFIGLENNTTLTELDISFNKLDYHNVNMLATCLKHNTSLTSLNISGCSICGFEFNQLLEALKVNNTLTELNIEKIKLTDKVKEKVKSVTELNRIYQQLSNYKYSVIGSVPGLFELSILLNFLPIELRVEVFKEYILEMKR